MIEELTLIDYFAGHALAGLLNNSIPSGNFESLTKRAYEVAKVMVKQKKREDVAVRRLAELNKNIRKEKENAD